LQWRGAGRHRRTESGEPYVFPGGSRTHAGLTARPVGSHTSDV
jgi:hypothetical protein